MSESLGERIRQRRTGQGFEVQHLAVALLVPPEAIRKLENDELPEVPREWLVKVAALTGLETRELIKDTNVHYYEPLRQIYVLRSEK